jgi:hypothetical protein
MLGDPPFHRQVARVVDLLFLLSIYGPSSSLSSMFVSATSSVAAERLEEDILLIKARAQIPWLQTKPGGYFSDKIEIRRANPLDRTSRMGFFAAVDLEADELLMTIPKEAIIEGIPTTADPKTESWFECDTAHKLSQEMRLGSNSTYSGYVEYLLEQSPGQIPSAWSSAGQDLLLEVLGQDEDGDGPLPPLGAVNWMKERNEACGGGEMMEDPLEKFAALMLLQRGWDTKLVPVFDMINHHSGNRWVSVRDPDVNHVDDVQVHSSRKIPTGEELFVAYGDVSDPQYSYEKWGTPEIFRDFGFIESYPRRFYFAEAVDMAFEIDYQEKDAKEAEIGCPLELTWLDLPNERGFAFLVEQYSRLRELSGRMQQSLTGTSGIPHHELDMVHQYYEAMSTALQMAVATITASSTTTRAGMSKTKCMKDGESGCTSVKEEVSAS